MSRPPSPRPYPGELHNPDQEEPSAELRQIIEFPRGATLADINDIKAAHRAGISLPHGARYRPFTAGPYYHPKLPNHISQNRVGIGVDNPTLLIFLVICLMIIAGFVGAWVGGLR